MATLDLGKVVGESATVTVGTTTTLPAGSNATVENVGTSLDAVLNFGIPKGADGETESSYNNLTNKPQINSVELNGNKSLNDLGIQPAGNYLTQETDPVFNASASAGITSQDITNWNNKSDFSGDYDDLTNKPTIPDSTSDLTNDSGFITNSTDGLTNYYTKTEVDGKVSAVYKYKGTVATYENLPSIGLTVGDVYNVETDGSNYAWNGTVWDKLGGDIDLSGYQTKIDSTHKLSSDLVDDTNNTNKFVTSTEKTTWGNKYDKPLAGIPKTDLANDVQTSLGLADTALQSHQDITGKEDKTNKVTSLSASSTDTEYPSAKAVYDALGAVGGGLEIKYMEDFPNNFVLNNNSSENLTDYIYFSGLKKGIYISKYFRTGGQLIRKVVKKHTSSSSLSTTDEGWERTLVLTEDIKEAYTEETYLGFLISFGKVHKPIVGNEYTNGIQYITCGSIGEPCLTNSRNAYVSGNWTFGTLPVTASSTTTPSSDNQFVNRYYVNLKQENLAPKYNTTTSYNVGDCVIYNGNLYMCNTQTSGAWVSGNWTQTNISSILGNISTVLSSLTTVQGGE